MGFLLPKAFLNHVPLHFKVELNLIRGRGAGPPGPVFEVVSMRRPATPSVEFRLGESFHISKRAWRRSALVKKNSWHCLRFAAVRSNQPPPHHVLYDVWSQ